MAPRFPCHVDDEDRLVPVHPERTRRLRGRDVWVSVHEHAALMKRSDSARNYQWGVVYAEIALRTGNDPESIHYGLKRKAVQVGVLEPELILMGSNVLEAEPTTVTDHITFWTYINWIRHEAEHGTLTGTAENPDVFHIPEPNEGVAA